MDNYSVCVVCKQCVQTTNMNEEVVCGSCEVKYKSDQPLVALQNKVKLLEDILADTAEELFSLCKKNKLTSEKVYKIYEKLITL